MSKTNGNGLPEGWARARLSDLLVALESGARPKGGVRGIAEGVPSVGGEHLNGSGGFDFASLRFVPESFYDEMKSGKVQIGDVLVVKDGATTGKTSLVAAGFPFQHAAVNEHVFLLRPSERVLSAFLFYFLWSDQGQRQIQANIRGAAQGGIIRGFAENVEVPVPPRSEQEQILGAIDRLLGAATMAESELQVALRKLVVFRTSVLNSLISTDAPRAQIGDIGEVFVGATPSRKDPANWGGPHAWVSSGEVAFCRISSTRESVTDAGLGNRERRLHPPGTILLAMIGEGKTRGQAAILDVPATHNQNSAAIRLDPRKMIPEFLYYCLMARYEQNRSSGSGSQQPALNGRVVRELVVPCPPLDDQQKAIARIQTAFDVLEPVVADLHRVGNDGDRLRQTVLRNAFRGDLSRREERADAQTASIATLDSKTTA